MLSFNPFGGNEVFSPDYAATSDGAQEPTVAGQSSVFDGLVNNAWDLLSIYGQYRAIDAEFDNDERPYPVAYTPANTQQLKNDAGSYVAGDPIDNRMPRGVMNLAVIGGGMLLLGTGIYLVVK